MDRITPLLIVVWAHLIADWCLQNDFVATNKGKNLMIMLVHCACWTGAVCVALHFLNMYAPWKMVFLFIGHFVMDEFKCIGVRCNIKYHEAGNGRGNVDKDNEGLLYVDQAWHLTQCIIVCL